MMLKSHEKMQNSIFNLIFALPPKQCTPITSSSYDPVVAAAKMSRGKIFLKSQNVSFPFSFLTFQNEDIKKQTNFNYV